MASLLYRFACRAFQKTFFVGIHFMPWREPQIVHGAGCLRELPKHLKANDIENVLLVTKSEPDNRQHQRGHPHLPKEQMQRTRRFWRRVRHRLRKGSWNPHRKAVDSDFIYARDAPRSS